MKKLFYYLLFPSILFSQTTPSVTPRADGEGSLGTETYRWGEGHFDELRATTPSLLEDSTIVPTTEWVNDKLSAGEESLVDFVYKNSSFTAEFNKKYTIDTSLGDITVTLPELSEAAIGSSILFRHSIGENNIVLSRSAINTILETSSHLTSYTFNGLGSYAEVAGYTSTVWLMTKSNRFSTPANNSDTNVTATTEWVNDKLDGSLLNYLENSGKVTIEGSLNIDTYTGATFLSVTNSSNTDRLFAKYDVYAKGIEVLFDDVGLEETVTTSLFKFNELSNSGRFAEYTIPLKVPTATAFNDSTLAANTAWVQDELAYKADQNSPFIDGVVTIDTVSETASPIKFRYEGGSEQINMLFDWEADGDSFYIVAEHEDTDPEEPLLKNTLLEFGSIKDPWVYIESKVPFWLPSQDVEMEYDDNIAATIGWVEDKLSTIEGGDSSDPVFTGVVTAPTIYSEQKTDSIIKIINPAGGAEYCDLTLGTKIVYITFPEFTNGNSFRVSMIIRVEGLMDLLFSGRISGSSLFDIQINGIQYNDSTSPVIITTGNAAATSGKFKIAIGIAGLSGSTKVFATIDQVTFYTFTDSSGTIREEYKDAFGVVAGAPPTGFTVIHTDYVYPSITTNSNTPLTGAILTEATPASSSATGTKGMIRYDGSYVYICTATDTWIRFEKATW